jgi:AraC-like DNA-binding protein
LFLLFSTINDKSFELPVTKLEEWSDTRNIKNSLIPYDLFILANTEHTAKAVSILKEKIDQRRGQIINFRQDPFLESLKSVVDFESLHHSNLAYDEIEMLNDPKIESTRLLDEEDTEHLKAKLLSYFEEDQPYLDPQLNLKKVAEILDSNANKVSYLINQVFKVNFNDFVNSYRLQYFKTIALDPKNAHITILGLAYDSGFNSKSVFNTYFKKIEGLTPRAWLKANS